MILIIEDNTRILNNLEKFFQLKGISVTCARDGLSGLEKFRKNKPDPVLMENILPRMSGEKICTAIRRESTKRIPIIMMGTSKKALEKLRAHRGMVDAILLKPFRTGDLFRQVKSTLGMDIEQSVPTMSKTGDTQGLEGNIRSADINRAEPLPRADYTPTMRWPGNESDPSSKAAPKQAARPAVDLAPRAVPLKIQKGEARGPSKPIQLDNGPAAARPSAAPASPSPIQLDDGPAAARPSAAPASPSPIQLDDGPAAARPSAAPASPSPIQLDDGPAAARPSPLSVEPAKGLKVLMEGELEEKSFAALLMEIFQKGLSGILSLSLQKVEKKIFFINGVVVYAKSDLRSENFGRFLVAKGKISEQDYQSAFDLIHNKEFKQGEALVQLGQLSNQELYDLLREQIEEKILNCFGWPKAHYTFLEDQCFIDSSLVFEMHPLPLIRKGIERFISESELSQAVEKLKSCSLHPTELFKRHLEILNGLYPRISFSALFGKERPFAEIMKALPLQPLDAGRLLKFLLVTGIIESRTTFELQPIPELAALSVGEGEELIISEGGLHMDDGHDGPAGKPKVASSEYEQAQSEKIIYKYLRMKTIDYFQILGVKRDSSQEEIRENYLSLASEYNPDRFMQIEDLGIRSKAKEIFLRISTAYGVLSDINARKIFEKELDLKKEEHQAREQSINAEIEFKEGEKLLRARDYQGAERVFQQAVDKNSKEPVYQIYYGWSLYKNCSEKDNEKREKAKNMIYRSIAMNPVIDIGYYYLGIIFIEQNQLREAEEMFNRALIFNPENTKAREKLASISKPHY